MVDRQSSHGHRGKVSDARRLATTSPWNAKPAPKGSGLHNLARGRREIVS